MSRRRRAFLIAMAVQCCLLGLSVFVVVSEERNVEPPAFVGERVVESSRSDDTRIDRVEQLKKRMSKPKSFQRLAVESSFESDLPAAPELPLQDTDFAGVEDSFLNGAESFLEVSDFSGFARGSGMQSTTQFFGVSDSGRRIVIVVNTSASVVRKAAGAGVSIERIHDEVIDLIEGLDRGTLFGVVQFSQGTRLFSDRLAPALARNKRAVAEWARSELRGNPPVVEGELVGHEAAWRAALSLEPDLIFFVTDGSLNRRERREGGGFAYPKISFDAFSGFAQREVDSKGLRPRLHIVGFELSGAEREGLSRLASRFGGTLREF